MLVQTISHYLESHKRLVIPQLGTFIVKEPGQCVLFSELLKRDDGVLRSLLHARGMHEIEVAGEIDRFVFEVRHAVERGGDYRLEGLGTLRPGDNGTIAFDYAPNSIDKLDDELRVPMPSNDALACDNNNVELLQTPRLGKLFARDHDLASTENLTRDPSLKGLRYSKPHKNTNAYTYVNQMPRRRIDRFVWIAVAAAVISLGAIAFGYFRNVRQRRIEAAQVAQVAQVARPVETVLPAGQATTQSPTVPQPQIIQ